jgi:hypothetical protein
LGHARCERLPTVLFSVHNRPDSTSQYDTDSLQEAIPEGSNLTFTFTEALLDNKTAALAKGHDAVCLFVNDTCDAGVLGHLHELGVVGPF